MCFGKPVLAKSLLLELIKFFKFKIVICIERCLRNDRDQKKLFFIYHRKQNR